MALERPDGGVVSHRRVDAPADQALLDGADVGVELEQAQCHAARAAALGFLAPGTEPGGLPALVGLAEPVGEAEHLAPAERRHLAADLDAPARRAGHVELARPGDGADERGVPPRLLAEPDLPGGV